MATPDYIYTQLATMRASLAEYRRRGSARLICAHAYMRSATPLSFVKWRRSSSHTCNIRQLEFTVVVVASYPALIL